MLGIDERRQCYRLGAVPHLKIIYSAHVTFDERHMPYRREFEDAAREGDFITGSHAPSRTAPLTAASDRPRRQWHPSAAALERIASQDPAPPDREGEEGAALAASDHVASAHHVYTMHDVDISYAYSTADTVEPSSHAEAMSRPDAAKWREAEISEYRSHVKNGTFGPRTKLPVGYKAIPAAWVYKIKRDGRYKCRLVIKGFHMKQGRDFNATFAPVAHASSVRTLFAHAALHDWEVKQGDVSTAFLAPAIDTTIYIILPAGFSDEPGLALHPQQQKDGVNLALKGVPGIPQGPHLWSRKSHLDFTAGGLERCHSDYSLYRMPGTMLFMIVWVDDFFLFFDRKHMQAAQKLWTHLRARMDLAEWQDVSDCLGCEIKRDRTARTITISQKKPVLKMLAKAGMQDCAPADTPVAAGFVFTKGDCPADEKARRQQAPQAKWYISTLASCIYFATWTRPDISFAISKLCKFMHNPGPKHLQALKRLLRYMKKTADLGLVYAFTNTPAKTGVYGYYDASHADDIDTRRSTLAYVYYMSGCLISWHTKLHTYVTTSTNHSEYCAAAKAAREAKWLEKLFNFLGAQDMVHPIALFSDSQGAIAMNYNPVNRAASKHVDLADHYAREQVERGTIVITYVRTTEMLADALTKALAAGPFEKHRLHFVGRAGD